MAISVTKYATRLTRHDSSWSIGLGMGTVVTYSFADKAPGYFDKSEHLKPMNAAEMRAVNFVLDLHEDVSNIQFNQVAASKGSMKFGTYARDDNIAAYAYRPGNDFDGDRSG